MGIRSLKELVGVLKVLAVPLRLRIIALLAERPMYAYEIQKRLKVSYPLVHLHLRALEAAGLVESYVVKEGERKKRYYKVKNFRILLTPQVIRELVGDAD